jgi:hypothetical protein
VVHTASVSVRVRPAHQGQHRRPGSSRGCGPDGTEFPASSPAGLCCSGAPVGGGAPLGTPVGGGAPLGARRAANICLCRSCISALCLAFAASDADKGPRAALGAALSPNGALGVAGTATEGCVVRAGTENAASAGLRSGAAIASGGVRRREFVVGRPFSFAPRRPAKKPIRGAAEKSAGRRHVSARLRFTAGTPAAPFP